MHPALLGGVFIGVLSALPVIGLGNCCCCLWIVGGGMLAAYLDQDVTAPRTLARGAMLGLLAGIAGAFIWLLASMALDVAMAPVRDQALELLRSRASDLPPEVAAWLDRMGEPGTGPLVYSVAFLAQLVICVIFGTIGGLLGALFFWRDNVPPALGGPLPPPPSPPSL